MSETLDIVIKLLQVATTLISLLVIFVKPFRDWVFKNKARRIAEEKKESNRDEAMRCTLRNIITSFYYSHRNMCELHQYEYENLAKIYKAYKEMGGNSFVDRIWDDMKGWTIVS